MALIASTVAIVLAASPSGAQPPLNGGGGWTNYPDANPNSGLVGQTAEGEIPANPSTDNWTSLADIATAFNNARGIENVDICPGGTCEPNAQTMPTTMVFPAGYAGWSSSDRALWLINSERVARGLQPFEGVDPAVTQVAQAWAQHLSDNDLFDHNANTISQIEAACTGCAGNIGTNAAENLASRSGYSWPNPAVLDGFGVENAIYNWMYVDRTQGGQNPDQFFGHRHALLWNSLSDDHGPAGSEGFIGVGVVKKSVSQFDPQQGITFEGEAEVVVWNAIDTNVSYPGAQPTPMCNGLTATLMVPAGGANFFGTGGNDVIVGTSGVDRVFGLGGNDTICGLGGDDNLNGGNGADWISGGDDNDFVAGQGGVDEVMGDDGNDEVVGGIGNDLLFGGPGLDLLRGQGNDDTINGDADVDVIFGGSGNDMINTGAGGNLGADCSATWAYPEVGSACPVTGNGNNDTITGSGDADDLDGQNGLDTVNGEGGDDLLRGGLGFDRLNGGDGNDTLEGAGSRDILHGDGDDDIVNGGGGDDDLFGDAGANDTCNGGPGTDSTPDASCETITGVP